MRLLFLFLFLGSMLNADKWESSASLYFWLPSIDANGNLNMPPPESDPSDPPLPIDPNAVLQSIDMVMMASFEARYNKYLFFTDVVYLDMSNTKIVSILNKNWDVALGFEGWYSSYIGGYNLIDSQALRLDFITGVQYFSLQFDVEVDKQSAKSRKHIFYDGLLDGVIGAKGEYHLNKQWFVPYYADIGGGASKLTYQVQTGIGYNAKWGAVMLTYRHLHWDFRDGALLNNFTLSGSSLAYRYTF